MEKQIAFYEQKLKFEVDSWDLFEALKNGEKVIALDARSKESFENEHIPGAINIPHRIMNPETTAQLNKEYVFITYCDGIGCNASTKGALKMAQLGFQVKELIGGIDWWKRDNYQTEGNTSNKGKIIDCGC